MNRILFLILLISNLFAGTVTIQYGDDIVTDCEITSLPYCYGDQEFSHITYYASNERASRYYYKFPIPVFCTEAKPDCVLFKVYKYYINHKDQDIRLSIHRIMTDFDSTYEKLYGRYVAPPFDSIFIDTSKTLKFNYKGWIEFNITNLFEDWISKKEQNNGIVVKMQNEAPPTYTTFRICQSLYPDSSKWPQVQICAPFLPDSFLTSPGLKLKSNKKVRPDGYFVKSYPNPFNTSTTIQFGIYQTQHVNITIYNINGKKIKRLHKAWTDAGFYLVQWDGNDSNDNLMPSGTYFCIVQGEYFVQTKKLLLLK